MYTFLTFLEMAPVNSNRSVCFNPKYFDPYSLIQTKLAYYFVGATYNEKKPKRSRYLRTLPVREARKPTCYGVMHNEDVALGPNCNHDFCRCAMLLNAHISGILTAT